MNRFLSWAQVLAAVWVFVLFASAATPAHSATVVTLVEYRHSLFDHYFVTPVPGEIALLDAHQPPFQYWSRTGLSFYAYANAGAPASSVANCRFFNEHFAPKSSHFYAPHGFGCEATLSQFPDWGLEDAALFNTTLPDAAGNCPAGSIPLYRLYNQGMGNAPNHRFVTSFTERQTMINQGWAPEGAGIGVGNCVPPSVVPATSAQGIWQGSTNSNQSVAGIVLADGTSYFLYTQSGTNIVNGLVLGNATFNNGALSAPNARDFNITPYGTSFAAPISGTYVEGSTINATVFEAGTTGTISLFYDPRYNQPANIAAASGTYTARVGSLGGWQDTTLTLFSNGAIVGGGNGCTFVGTASPHGSVNVIDVSVTFNGGGCLFGTSTIHGVAFYDPAIRTLYGAAPNAGRTDALIFIGTK